MVPNVEEFLICRNSTGATIVNKYGVKQIINDKSVSDKTDEELIALYTVYNIIRSKGGD